MQFVIEGFVDGRARNNRSLTVEAVDEAAAMAQATALGWRVVRVDRAKVSRLAARATERSMGAVSGKKFDLLLFAQELLALLDAGLRLPEAITTLVKKERRPSTAAVLAEVQRTMNEGKRFSDCLEALPEAFPVLFVATARAAETTGTLPTALTRYVAYSQQFADIRRKLVGALLYPGLVLIVGVTVSIFLIGFVVPRFAVVYESTGRDLPWLSSLLLMLGRLLNEHALILGVSVLLFGAFIRSGLARTSFREAFLSRLLALPLISTPAKTFRLSRLYRTMALLLEAGVPVSRSMQQTENLLLPAERAALQIARQGIESGKSFSESLQSVQLATPIADSLLKTGERSGQLAGMLLRAAQFHDAELERQLDYLTRVIEPVLMAVLGLLIGGVVILLYLPIFDLASSL